MTFINKKITSKDTKKINTKIKKLKCTQKKTKSTLVNIKIMITFNNSKQINNQNSKKIDYV